MAKKQYTAEEYIKVHRPEFTDDIEFKAVVENTIEYLSVPCQKANKHQIKFFNEVLQALNNSNLDGG